jgi:hypothetical protein
MPYLKKKKKLQKRACRVAQGVGPEFKLQHFGDNWQNLKTE